MYDALRKGFSLCHGEVLGWINADDFYLPGALKKVCSVFEDNEEVNWIAGCCSVIDERTDICISPYCAIIRDPLF